MLYGKWELVTYSSDRLAMSQPRWIFILKSDSAYSYMLRVRGLRVLIFQVSQISFIIPRYPLNYTDVIDR